MVGDRRQGWAVYRAMAAHLRAALVYGCVAAEQHGNPVLAALGVDRPPARCSSGGNMEGKEVRFGIADSALWATATTAASNGSVNAMHDSFTPLGGLVPMWLMQLGEVVFGGVGSGLYGMLMFAIVAVFIAGLMVGRTPEYLGKKIEAFEMKMASLVILVPRGGRAARDGAAPCVPRAGAAAVLQPRRARLQRDPLRVLVRVQQQRVGVRRAHRERRSSTRRPGHRMLIGRYWMIVPVLAIAGFAGAQESRARQRGHAAHAHAAVRRSCWSATVLLVGALTFVPALALGPVVEHLQLFAR